MGPLRMTLLLTIDFSVISAASRGEQLTFDQHAKTERFMGAEVPPIGPVGLSNGLDTVGQNHENP